MLCRVSSQTAQPPAAGRSSRTTDDARMEKAMTLLAARDDLTAKIQQLEAGVLSGVHGARRARGEPAGRACEGQG